MSLSTSSFRTELKVLAVVLLALLLAEVVIRLWEPRLSLDVKHIQQIPMLAQNLNEQQGKRILFLGNSQVRAGVDPEIIQRELGGRGVEQVHIERVFPDSTSLPDWYYAFKHYFVEAGRKPDVVILCFADRALQDNYGINPTRLAHYYTGVRDTPEVFKNEVHDFDGRTEFVFSRLFYSFANRTRLRTRILDLVIPNYRDTAQLMNRDLKKERKKERIQPTYALLQRFLDLARQQGIDVVLLAMPQPKPYTVDPEIPNLAKARGMVFVDGREPPGITSGNFIDEVHLGAEGATIYSHFLGGQLALTLKPRLAISSNSGLKPLLIASGASKTHD